jgi:small subunit ribosomal protein S4
MSHRTKFKMQRALGLELPGLGKPGALEKRSYGPGQHGQARKSKLTGFALQLREKQKLLFHYGLREEQLRRFVRTARALQASNWVESLVGLLERRLDNVVFRMGFARSIASARQLVSHGHILVNGRPLTIGSATLRNGDFVRLTDAAALMESTLQSRLSPRLTLPSYLQFAHEGADDHGVLLSQPRLEHVPFEFNSQQVAEYYASRGV